MQQRAAEGWVEKLPERTAYIPSLKVNQENTCPPRPLPRMDFLRFEEAAWKERSHMA